MRFRERESGRVKEGESWERERDRGFRENIVVD